MYGCLPRISACIGKTRLIQVMPIYHLEKNFLIRLGLNKL